MTSTWISKTLGGRYFLEKTLGIGATATVFEALDEQLRRRVAVKMLRPEAAGDPDAVESFQREAQAAAGLHHPNLAGVYDSGTEDGLPYIVMERVAGAPLEIGRPIDVDRAVDIGIQVAGALAFIHQNGLLHSDVKPGNLLMDAEGKLKLVDLGMASPVDVEPPPQATATATGGATQQIPVVKASPGLLPYLAPERLAGGPPSPAADVYGLGAVLYALLAGRPPYEGDTPDALAWAQESGPSTPLRELNQAVPPTLAALLAEATARDPAARFGSATAMQTALEQVRGESSQVTAATPVIPAAAQPGDTVNLARRLPAGLSRWGLPAIGGVVALLLLGLLIGAMTRGKPATEGAGAAPATSVSRPIPTVARKPVPQLLGLTLAHARQTIEAGGWKPVEAPPVNGSAGAGLITSQQPAAGDLIAPGAPLTVTVSLGPAPLPPTAVPAAPAPTAVPQHAAPAPPPAPAHGGKEHGGKGHGK
ncbi:MAG: serine/threonine-protein kinase [Chloroflexia bacterium]